LVPLPDANIAIFIWFCICFLSLDVIKVWYKYHLIS